MSHHTAPLQGFYQGLIQAAVGLHHFQHANIVGHRGQLAKAIGHLTENLQNNPHSIDTKA